MKKIHQRDLLMRMRSNGIQLVLAAESCLQQMGHPVQSAIVPRDERQRLAERNEALNSALTFKEK